MTAGMRGTTLVVWGALVATGCAGAHERSLAADPVVVAGSVERSCSHYAALFTGVLQGHVCSVDEALAADLDGDGDPELLLTVRTTPLRSALGPARVEHLLVTRRAGETYQRRLRLEDELAPLGTIVATRSGAGRIEVSVRVLGFHCEATRQAHVEIAEAAARIVWDEAPHCEPEHYTEVFDAPDSPR